MNEYTAHIEAQGWSSDEQALYVWRKAADGRLEVVSMGDLVVSRVELEEHAVPIAKPFMRYHMAVWPEVDGILKALHDLYRKVHGLDDTPKSTALDQTTEALLATMDSTIEVERRRVDAMIDRLMAKVTR